MLSYFYILLKTEHKYTSLIPTDGLANVCNSFNKASSAFSGAIPPLTEIDPTRELVTGYDYKTKLSVIDVTVIDVLISKEIIKKKTKILFGEQLNSTQ